MDEIIEKVRKELIAASDRKTRESGMRFFREEVNLYGIRSQDVREISRRNFVPVKERSKHDIFIMCSTLWKSGMMEESFIACEWSHRLSKQYLPEDFMIFEEWVMKYVNNWASCDTFCNHTVGDFIQMYPEFLSGLKKWALSENRWMRRASAVSLIIPARRGKYLPDIFEISELLLQDRDDMVQKGYGWMLKEASKPYRNEVFDFVMRKKHLMPRTALRYAIEKMPTELREKAMAR